MEKIKPGNRRITRNYFTALGKIYYGSEQWKRLKIESEVFCELGIKKHSIRAYMVSTPAYRMRADMKKIILRTLPEAESCFEDPRIEKISK